MMDGPPRSNQRWLWFPGSALRARPRNDSGRWLVMSTTQIRLARLGLIVALVALWEIYARFVSTSSLVAGPIDVALAWWPKVVGDERVLWAVFVTLVELVIAFALSV